MERKLGLIGLHVAKAKLQVYAITVVIAYALALGELKHVGWSKLLAKPLFELPGYTTAHKGWGYVVITLAYLS